MFLLSNKAFGICTTILSLPQRMNIQDCIIRGIQELLYKHDYLVVPGFGGFVLKHQNAMYSSAGTSLLPPSKKLGFNKQLRQSDGVLLNWLQNELSCNASEAQLNIDEFSDYCNSILQNRRRLSIEHLGFFYLDFENNLCFEPKTDVNFLSDSFGLSPVHFSEIKEELPKETPVLKSNLFENRTAPKQEEMASNPKAAPSNSRFKRTGKTVAYLAVFGFFVLALSFVLSSVGVQGPIMASFYGSSKAAVYSPIEYKPVFSLNENKKKAGAFMISTSNNESLLELDEETHFVVRRGSSSINSKFPSYNRNRNTNISEYNIVFGCFSVKGNATRFAKQLEKRNYPVQITKLVDKDLFMVAVGGYSDKISQRRAKPFKIFFPNAWIKKLP